MKVHHPRLAGAIPVLSANGSPLKKGDKIMKRFAFAFTALAFSAGISGAAHACSPGFLADLACRAGIIDQATANGLDDLNKALGKPVEQGAAIALDTFVAPGTGRAFLGTQGMGAVPQMGGQMSLLPQGSPFPQQGLTPLPPQPANLGNICATMSGYYPGPFNPVGMPCTAFTPWGVEGGVVVN